MLYTKLFSSTIADKIHEVYSSLPKKVDEDLIKKLFPDITQIYSIPELNGLKVRTNSDQIAICEECNEIEWDWVITATVNNQIYLYPRPKAYFITIPRTYTTKPEDIKFQENRVLRNFGLSKVSIQLPEPMVEISIPY